MPAKKPKRKACEQITRSVRISLGKINFGKKAKLIELHKNCKILVQDYINFLWKKTRANLPGKDIYERVKARFDATARLKQTMLTQAITMVNNVKDVIAKKEDIYNWLVGVDINAAKKLRNKIDALKITKPKVEKFSLNLNANFITIYDNENKENVLKKDKNAMNAKHANWIKISSLGINYNMFIPFNKTKIYNRWDYTKDFIRSNYIQIDEEGNIKMVFTSNKKEKANGIIVGCDIGATEVTTLSEGDNKISPIKFNHGTINSLSEIMTIMTKTKKNTVRYRRLATTRKYFINYMVKKVFSINDHSDWKQMNLEKITIQSGSNQFLNKWSHSVITSSIINLCEENSIEVLLVLSNNTSRMCNDCKWVFSGNRKGKKFICTKCKVDKDADLNASYNIRDLKKNELIHCIKNKKITSEIGYYYHK